MEFIVHMPHNISPEGTLWQTWNTFYQKFKYYQNTELQRTSLADVSSLLLFAAHHHIDALCSALGVYDLDFMKLNTVLQVVEETCLPYFILLFERFRYFSLNRDILSQTDELNFILEKQAGICEFGNLKEGIVTHALCGSLKSGLLLQHLSNPDGLHMDDIKALYNEIEKTQNGALETTTTEETQPVLPVPESVPTEVVKKEPLKRSKRTPKPKRHHDELFFDTDVIPAITGAEIVEVNDDLLLPLFQEADISETKPEEPSASVIDEVVQQIMKKRFQCCFCDRAFVGHRCLRTHFIKAHKNRKKFVCNLCNVKLSNPDKYIAHWSTLHAVRKQKVPKTTQLPDGTLVPTKTRKRKLIHTCTMCGQFFIRRTHLLAHIQEAHSKSYICWYCGETFNVFLDYKIHAVEHRTQVKFSCDLCQRQYTSLFGLNVHLHRHLVAKNKCELCPSSFFKLSNLAKHLKKHVMQPTHVCPVCGKSFAVEARLQVHMGIHTGDRRYTCEICGKSYAHRNNWVHHQRWHTGEKPYGCEKCDKRFRCVGDLSKHRRYHFDKAAYVCEVCGRGFNDASALRRHKKGHSGKRAYACNVCGRTFIYSGGLRDHIKANRCPGVKTENSLLGKRVRRSNKLVELQPTTAENIAEMESTVYIDINPVDATEETVREVQTWHFLLRKEAEKAAVVVMAQ